MRTIHLENKKTMAVREEMVHIEGMSCGHCVKAVEEALLAVEGVEVHAVEIGSAQISYDPDAADPTRIVAAIEDAGYAVPAPT